MPINKSYQQLSCYKNLMLEYQHCLDKLAETYGERLNAPISVGGSLFTLHDFNHHCYNLYRIISTFLCDLSIDQGGGNRLSEHELFLLDLSILFHDIGMSTLVNLKIDRNSHSRDSAEWVQKEWDKHSDCLYEEGQKISLSANDIRAVSEIIRAHSDIKGPDAPQKNGIYAVTLLEEMPSSRQMVRAKFLAGILRMADELDITSDRIGDCRLADQLDPDDPDNKASMEHWESLNCFSHICHNKVYPTRLSLVLDDQAISRRIDSGDEAAVLAMIWRVEKKINREFSEIRQEIFQKTAGSREIIRIDSIEIASSVDAVIKYIEKKESGLPERELVIPSTDGSILLKGSFGEETANKKQSSLSEEGSDKQIGSRPQVLSLEVQKLLDSFIVDQKLIESGHFLMNERYCARDWVNTLSVLEDQNLSERCIQIIAQHIRQTQTQTLKNTVILGLDLNGTLLGARIAAILRYPFAFLIPFRKVSMAGTPDKTIDISKFDRAIFVTDAVVTGATLNELIKHHHLQDKIPGIYTLLYRQPMGAAVDQTLQLSHPIYCISDTFQIEVMEKKDCHWVGKIGCIASNQVVR